jgi:EAL domain-containing protein (putative c-di-GMP-specific phosphodiesterase class I)
VQLLREAGCDELQGYYFAKPMSNLALQMWLTDQPACSAGIPGSQETLV